MVPTIHRRGDYSRELLLINNKIVTCKLVSQCRAHEQ